MRPREGGGRGVPAWAVLWLLSTVAPAQAFDLGGWFGGGGLGTVVYDPTNHLETAVSASEAVRQTALQVRAEVQRLQQLSIEVQQWRTLSPETVRAALADWDSQLGSLAAAGKALSDLSAVLEDTRQRSAARLRQISLLGVSPQTFLAREVAAAAVRQQSADTVFAADRQGLASLLRSRQALAALQAQIPASSGMQQSLQTTNQYLDLLAGQSSQLLQLSAAQFALQAQQRSQQEADSATAAAREAERTAQDFQDIASLRQGLRAQEAGQGWGALPPLP